MRETVGFKAFRIIVIVVLTLFVIFPLYVMLTSSVKPLVDVSSVWTWWPTSLTIQPFIDIWNTVPLAKYFGNSLIVSLIASLCSVVIAIFAAYGVSRFKFRGRSVFTTAVLSTQMFPGILFLLPLYVLFVNLGETTGIELYGYRPLGAAGALDYHAYLGTLNSRTASAAPPAWSNRSGSCAVSPSH